MKSIKPTKQDIYNYKISMKKKSDKFQLSIECLNLYADGPTFDKAIKNLEYEFEKLKINYNDFENTNQSINNKYNFQNLRLDNTTISFAIKTSIIGFVFVISSIYLTSFITNKISQISIVEIMKSESNKIKGYLKNEEQNLLKLNDVIMTLKPYLRELRKINDEF